MDNLNRERVQIFTVLQQMSNIALPIDKQMATLAEFGKVILMRTAPALAKRYLIPSFPERERAVSMVLAPHMERRMEGGGVIRARTRWDRLCKLLGRL